VDRLRDGEVGAFSAGSEGIADAFVQSAGLWARREFHLGLEDLDALLVGLERAGFVAALGLEFHQRAIDIFSVGVAA